MWHADVDRIRKNFSKNQRVMPKTVREKEIENFAINFTYDTQRIDGSTLTRRETVNLLERGLLQRTSP
jgi:hypothetical protein